MTLDQLAAQLQGLEHLTRLQVAVTYTVAEAADVLWCGPKAVRGLNAHAEHRGWRQIEEG